MSERSYFNLRNAIPGYTFILIILSINYYPLLRIIQRVPGIGEQFGTAIPILVGLGGSAIGFLVSQFWYAYFRWRGASSHFSAFKKMVKKYKISHLDKQCKIGIWTYIMHRYLACDKMKEVVKVTQRRWDTYHTVKATMTSIILGTIVGWKGRIIFSACKEVPFNCNRELPILVPIMIMLIAIFLLLCDSANWVLKQYNVMCEIILKEAYCNFNIEDLTEIIPCINQ